MHTCSGLVAVFFPRVHTFVSGLRFFNLFFVTCFYSSSVYIECIALWVKTTAYSSAYMWFSIHYIMCQQRELFCTCRGGYDRF